MLYLSPHTTHLDHTIVYIRFNLKPLCLIDSDKIKHKKMKLNVCLCEGMKRTRKKLLNKQQKKGIMQILK